MAEVFSFGEHRQKKEAEAIEAEAETIRQADESAEFARPAFTGQLIPTSRLGFGGIDCLLLNWIPV